MSNETTQVAIIMGSDSDLPVVEAIFPILDSFGVKYTKNVMSAHRTPHAVMELIKKPAFFEGKFIIESRSELSGEQQTRILVGLIMMVLLEAKRG